jgi:hypothetical protein
MKKPSAAQSEEPVADDIAAPPPERFESLIE